MYNIIMRFYNGQVITLDGASLHEILFLYRQYYKDSIVMARVYLNHVFQYTIV